MSPKKRSPRNAKNRRGRDNCPVIVDKEYDVDITGMSPNGEGIARINGFVIFVANAKLGVHAKVRIKSLDSVSADAELVS
ncbi:MAG TPA: TRAM domain-containing protein [Candidatus Sulfotelmatobacter sp.]|nr:TRAM domain-containing protein [Candidatus Sulfotelmatobacter sp.]